jgi:tetratricopeptide (TPR) repeat protein
MQGAINIIRAEMSNLNWLEFLNWSDKETDDLRFVGYSYIQQGQYDIAINFFEALVVLNPENAYDAHTLGALYLQKGKSLEALKYLDKALELEPNHYPTLLNRAKALFALGYKKQALLQLRDLKTCSDQKIVLQAEALELSQV